MSSPGRDSGAAERLAGIAEALPVAVVVLRARDGTVLYANEQASAMLGLTDLGRAIDDVLSAPGALAVLTADSGGEVEIDCKRGDGTPISLTAVCRRVGFEHEERESKAVLAVLRDDTERRRAEQSHAEQAAALALLAELPEKNPGPVCRLAADGTILMANAAARRFLGDGSDLRGRNWLDVVPGMTDEIWRWVLDSDSRTPHEAERNGTSIMFTHVRSASGELVFAYGADITARKAQERLAAQKAAEVAEIARFPEMNPGPVLRMDRQATVLMANQAARGVFGAELLGRGWLDLCPGMDDAAWAGILDSSGIVRREASIGERVYTFAHRWDARSQLVFVYGTDITALKQAERALRQSERMATLGTLAAGVAHELNNPAAATARAAGQLRDALVRLDEAHLRLEAAELTRDGVELLRRLEHQSREWAGRPSELGPLERSDREAEIEDWLDEHGVEDAWDLAPQLVAFGVETTLLERLAATLEGEALAAALSWAASSFRAASLSHEIRQGSARISEIVGALKSYSYLGQAPVQAVDVHEALDNTLVILRNKLKHGIEVIRDYSADLPPVHAWGSELNQVWTNLLDNAADAMGRQGEIIIRTRREGDKAVVEISDNGPGIPEPIQPRIFDPFFTTKEPGKGTGLGLATTWSIITERHHGTITVESRPGRTCFTVRLPIAGPPPEPEGSGEETVP